jgi:hypothetical protein
MGASTINKGAAAVGTIDNRAAPAINCGAGTGPGEIMCTLCARLIRRSTLPTKHCAHHVQTYKACAHHVQTMCTKPTSCAQLMFQVDIPRSEVQLSARLMKK